MASRERVKKKRLMRCLRHICMQQSKDCLRTGQILICRRIKMQSPWLSTSRNKTSNNRPSSRELGAEGVDSSQTPSLHFLFKLSPTPHPLCLNVCMREFVKWPMQLVIWCCHHSEPSPQPSTLKRPPVEPNIWMCLLSVFITGLNLSLTCIAWFYSLMLNTPIDILWNPFCWFMAEYYRWDIMARPKKINNINTFFNTDLW